MASRGHGWFDDAKLLQGERILRSGRAQVRMSLAPYWWDGELYLTTDRLFFLPHVEHPALGTVALWLHDVAGVEADGRDGLKVHADDGADFRLTGWPGGLAAVIGGRAAGWLAAIADARTWARPRSAFTLTTRRVAG